MTHCHNKLVLYTCQLRSAARSLSRRLATFDLISWIVSAVVIDCRPPSFHGDLTDARPRSPPGRDISASVSRPWHVRPPGRLAPWPSKLPRRRVRHAPRSPTRSQLTCRPPTVPFQGRACRRRGWLGARQSGTQHRCKIYCRLIDWFLSYLDPATCNIQARYAGVTWPLRALMTYAGLSKHAGRMAGGRVSDFQILDLNLACTRLSEDRAGFLGWRWRNVINILERQ